MVGLGQLQAAGVAGAVLAAGAAAGLAGVAVTADLRAGSFVVWVEVVCERRVEAKESARRRVQGPMRMRIPFTGSVLLDAFDFNRSDSRGIM
jgi:hypothetical protein